MRKTSKILKVSIATISRWCKSVDSKKRKTQHVYDRDLLCFFIKSKLIEKPFLTASELKKLIEAVLGMRISISLVYVIIDTIGFSYKRARKRGFTTQKEERTNVFKQEYRRLSTRLIVAVDESGFHHAPSPVYGWSKKGKKVILQYKESRCRKRHSLLMAVSNRGEKFYQVLSENIDSLLFSDFIQQLPYPEGSILLMDNASIHKTKLMALVCQSK